VTTPAPRLADAYAGFICDLDGVVRRGSSAVTYAVEQLRALSSPVVYATNNASLTPAQVARQLGNLGLNATPADVVTSSQAGAAHLASHLSPGASVLAVGGPGVGAALEEVGLTAVDRFEPGVTAVLQGYGPQVTALDLAEASYAIEAGATWVATNRDTTLPTERGIAPGNGALLAAVQLATSTEPIAMGKPERPLYDLAVARLDQAPPQVLAIGDRLDTDILGAMAAGLHCLWVLTGVDTLVSFAVAPGRPRPTYVGLDLRALRLPAAEPRRDGEEWVCGTVRLGVDWRAGTVTLSAEQASSGVATTSEADDAFASRSAIAAAGVAALVHGRDERGASPDLLVRVAEHVTERLC
jgi:glycerol-1-phosphatase